MEVSKVQYNGKKENNSLRTTIPKKIANKLGILNDSHLGWEINGEKILITKL